MTENKLELGGPRRRVGWAMLATGVAALVAACGAAHGLDRKTGPAAVEHVAALPAPARLPAGLRVASIGAVSLRVPANLPTRTSLCGQRSVANEVVVDLDPPGFAPCSTPVGRSSVGASPVVWLTDDHHASPYRRIPATARRLAGQPVEQGYATASGDLGTGVSGVVRIPGQRVLVGVTAPTRAAVDRMLNSIWVARTDPLGCPARHGTGIHLLPGPADVLVPPGADAAVRCDYDLGGTLIGSYRLDPGDTARLAGALNELRPDPCGCVHLGTTAPGHSEVVFFRVAGRWTLEVDGAIGANLDSWTNGDRDVVNFSSAIVSLLDELTNQS